MKLFAVKGGVHPPERKYTEHEPIKRAPLPERVVVYMLQHAGVPAKPVVSPGQEVWTGQVIGEPAGPISAYVHSPVTGRVVSVSKVNSSVHGTMVEAVVIERTGDDQWQLLPNVQLDSASREELIEQVKLAGIVGLGGAMFPTHVKLNPPKPVDTLILNGAECEPYLTIDHRVMLERYEDILIGVEITKKIVGAKNVYIGIETNKRDAIELLERKWKGKVTVVPLRTKYPMGAEKQLIKAITGREVPSGGLPMDVGVLVQNVSTMVAIKEAIVDRKPLVERGLTLTGEAVRSRGNWWVRIGSPISWIIETLGGGFMDGSNGVKVLMGGPMTGIPVGSLDTPILKGNNGITVLTEAQRPSTNCIRCSYCVQACPMGLQPYLLDYLARRKRYDDAVSIGLMDCIECGSCSYICPANVEHVKSIKLAKKVYRALRGGKK